MKIAALAAVLLHLLLLNACKKEENNNPAYPIPGSLKLLAGGYANGSATRVDIYAADSFFVGYNDLYIALYDSSGNERVTNAQITLTPLMSMMGGMSHTCPVENPASNQAKEGLFHCAAVYIMPSSTGNTWALNVNISNNENGLSGTVAFNIRVVTPTVTSMKSLIAKDDSTKLFVSIVNPLTPVVGTNEFEITIHKKGSMMSFPACDEYTTEVNPQMLSMGHGSPLNENPTLTANGHYKGNLNFTMSGDWRVYLKLYHNGVLADSSLYFDMTLP